MEREQVGERTQLAMDRVAREGRARSRFTPFGWRTADGSTEVIKGDRRELVRHPEEQKALRRITKLIAKGMGPRRVARALNEAGLNPRSGRPWTYRTVERIMATLARREAALRAA